MVTLLDVRKLSFTVVGDYPEVASVDDIYHRLSRLHQLSLVNILLARHAVAGSYDDRIAEVELCQFDGSLCQTDSRFVLSQTVSLFTFHQRGRMFGTEHLFVACLTGFVGCLYIVVLLTGDRFLLQQLLVTLVVAFGIFHLYACLLDTGITHPQVILCGSDTHAGSLLSRQCVGKIGFCLSQTQLEFGILDDDQRITLVYRLILFETNLLDETLYTSIHRSDMLFHLSIVGIFHARMNEA